MTALPAVDLRITLSLAFLIGGTAFAVDGTLPALPATAEALGVEVARVQPAVGLFLMGYALGQIPIGLLSDRYGRLPVLYTGMSLFFLTALIGAASTSADMLLGLRFVQGMFGATGAVLSRTIARDLTDGPEMVRLMSFLSSFVGLAMVTAPLIGSFLLWGFGWRGAFGATALFGGVGLWLSVLYLPESRPPGQPDKAWVVFRAGITAFLGSSKALLAAGLMTVNFAALMVFITLSSDIFIRAEGYSEIGFGLIFAMVAFGFFSGAAVLRRFSRRWAHQRLMMFSAATFGVATVLLLSVTAIDAPPLGLILAGSFFYMAAISTMLALTTTLALEDLGKTAGMGAGLMGTAQMGIGGAFSTALTLLQVDTLARFALLLGAMTALVGLCGALLAWHSPRLAGQTRSA